MKTVWVNVTTQEGELVARIAIGENERPQDRRADIEEAVERAQRIQAASLERR